MSCEGLEGELSLRGSEATKQSHSSTTPSTGAELRLPTSLGELHTVLPQVYQISPGGSRSDVDAKFEIVNKNEFGITLPNGYQKEHTLRIDPLIYSTFLGGAGTDQGYAITSDESGEVIVTGLTTSTDFPVTAGVIQPILQGNPDDCFITKLNNDGSSLVFSTYLSCGLWTQGNAITSDGSGGAIVTGATYTLGNVRDVFIARVNSTGSQLVYSLVLGGMGDDIGYAIVGDGQGGAIATGSTWSPTFPITPGTLDTTYQNGSGFVTKVSSTGQIVYSTFLPNSYGYGITSDDSGGVFLTGACGNTFPTTTGAYDTTYNGGGFDAFVAHLNSTGSQFLFSTYLGGSGSGEEWGTAIVKANSGNVIVVGGTHSPDFPTTPGAFDTVYSGTNGIGFITRLNATGTQLINSTFLPNGGGLGVFCGQNNSIVLTGNANANFPTTFGAFDTSYGGNVDAFIAQFNGSCSQLIYSSYLGGSLIDIGQGIIGGSNNDAFVLGYSNSPEFPRTTGSFDTTYHNSYDCFITHIELVADSDAVVSSSERMPIAFSLNQNDPNPFNSSTTISYSLPKPGIVELKLYDLLGREVTTLVNRKQSAGSYRVNFDRKNLSSGTYFIRMQAGDFVKTQKMVLLK